MSTAPFLISNGRTKIWFITPVLLFTETESFSESEFYKDSGWNVTVVVPDTAAEKYGLQINDIILAIDDYDINRSHDLTYILNLYHSPGDTITFEILRNGDVIYLDFILGTR